MGCVEVDLSVASDYLYYTQNGSTNEGVIAMSLGVMNQVDTDYDDAFTDEIRFKITENFISACSTCDPWSASLNITTVLNSFRTWGNGGNFTNTFDLAQLWSGRDFNGTTIGVAYLNAVCSTSRYHVLQNITDSGWQLRVLTSHEIGHNFNANHDASGSFIMSPSISNIDVWSTTSVNAINTHASNATCLGACSLHISSQNTPVTWLADGSNQETISWDVNGSSGLMGCSNVDILFSFDGGGSFPYTLVSNTSNDGSHTFTVPSIPATTTGRVKVVCTNNVVNDINNADINLDSPCAPALNFYIYSGPTTFTQGQTIDLDVTEYYSETSYDASTFGSFGSVGHTTSVTSTVCTPRPNTSYETFSFTVSQTGNYTFNQNPAFAAFSLYDGTHNPSAACTNFLSSTFYVSGGGTGISSGSLTESLTAGDTYELVVTSIFGNPENVGFTGPGELGTATGPTGYDYTYIAVNETTGLIDMQDAAGIFTGIAAGTYDIIGVSYENDGVAPDVDPATFIGQTTNALIVAGECVQFSSNSEQITITGSSMTWYLDSDGDTYGDVNMSMSASTQPPGYVSDSTDCDDTDNTVFPGATELCDGQVNNCGGTLSSNEVDNDSDQYIECIIDAGGWDGPGTVVGGDDCDDNDNTVYPGATELCDGKDNDCDGQIDEGATSTFYADSDGDGFGDASTSMQACSAPTGYVSDDTDCDDNDGNNYPGNTEVCDGQDNDCDGQIDEGATSTFYADNDGDGFGDASTSMQACSAPTGYVSDDTDCDDNDANNYPGNTEVCDGQDNDCDGQVDEGCNSGTCDGAILVINAITQNSYLAQVSIESSAVVNSSSGILFSAGTEIDLLAGFEVVLGTDFEAVIAPCTPFNAPSSDRSKSSTLLTDLPDLLPWDIINVRITNHKEVTLIQKDINYEYLKKFILSNVDKSEGGVYVATITKGELVVTQKILITSE